MKKVILATGVSIFLFLSIANQVSAADHNHEFVFKIKGYYQNSYSSQRYRQTGSKDNPWKANLVTSSEGSGTKMHFWLDAPGNVISSPVASKVYKVTQGTGANYYPAYSRANKRNVRLGSENNNYSTRAYTISGFWDEETW